MIADLTVVGHTRAEKPCNPNRKLLLIEAFDLTITCHLRDEDLLAVYEEASKV